MKLVRKILVAMLLGTMAIQVVWADINEDFIKAAYQCDLDKVKQLLRLGADVNADNGQAFIKAHSCNSKAIKIMEYLISQGLDINTKRNNRTVLDDTLVMNLNFATDYNLIKYLVYKGANVNVRVYDSNELFYKLVSAPSQVEEHIDIIEYVLSKGAVIGASDLDYMFVYKFSSKIRTQKMSAKEWAIIKLAIKNAKNLDYCNTDGRHDLKLRNKEGQDKVADLLLQKGLNINHQCERSGYTRLMGAYDLDEVKYLVSKGADVNIKDNKGETALTKALNSKKYDIAEFLISKGAKK